MVIAPADAITDAGDTRWTVVGPTGDAHFDKQAGAAELNRLSHDKQQRQQQAQQHQEWQRALGSLQHRLQEFLHDYPRGWFSGHRQQLDIVQSRLDEASQLVLRISATIGTLEGEAEQARQALHSLTTSRSTTQRARDRLDEFERNFGSQVAVWRQELTDGRSRAVKDRQLQADSRQRSTDLRDKARQAQEQASTERHLAAQLGTELAKVKHVDEQNRRPEVGQTEELRSRYSLLLADYEGQVNAESLNQLATAKDQEADKCEREFQRVLQRFSDITPADVDAELQQLPAELTAQVKAEHADAAHLEAVRKLGPLKNRLNGVIAEFQTANSRCAELEQSGPLPTIHPLDFERHSVQAVEARQAAYELRQFADEFAREASEVEKRLTHARHELEKVDKDRQRLQAIRTNHQRLFDRLATVTLPAATAAAVIPLTVKDGASLAQKLGEVEQRLRGVQAQHEGLDSRREAICKEISAWSRQERFTKLPSSVCHRFVDRDAQALETKAEWDILQLDDCVFQIQEKLKEADQQRDIVVHVLVSAVDEALELLKRVSRMSRLPDSLPQAGKQFLKIETKASEIPAERQALVGELIDELLDHGEIGDGLRLVLKPAYPDASGGEEE